LGIPWQPLPFGQGAEDDAVDVHAEGRGDHRFAYTERHDVQLPESSFNTNFSRLVVWVSWQV